MGHHGTSVAPNPPLGASLSGAGTSTTVSAPRGRSLEPQSGSEDSDNDEAMVRALRKMGIRHPRPFDPKEDRNFETGLERTEFHFS
ncbi:hypothetical protein NL529_27365, partial [Klebsiella pneumoniae]|nr:hypothetical protein [Klebsiella pneumoniae]